MKRFRLRLFIPVLLLATLLGGCTALFEEPGPTVIATSEAFKLFSGEYENTAWFARNKPRSIAVAPFAGEDPGWTEVVQGMRPNHIVRRGFYNHVASLPFRDLELYDTDLRLKNAGLQDASAVLDLLQSNPRKLQSILGVDAVVTGEVTHFDRVFGGIYSQVAVGCEVKMWDLANGELLWRATHVSRAHAGGLSISPVGLAMAAVSAAWNLREVELLRQTDDLFREMVSTIELPESMRHTMLLRPNLDLFVCLNPEKIFTGGNRIAFRLIGDADSRASVDLGDYRHGIQLSPVAPAMRDTIWDQALEHIQVNYAQSGYEVTPALLASLRTELAQREIYEGAYTVMPGEEAHDLLARGHLVNAAGARATEVFVTNSIHIDANPPAAPQGLEATGLDRRIRLEWVPNTEADLGGYEIWQSTSPLSGYTRLQSTEVHHATLEGYHNFQTHYFQVRARDRAGNLSAFSASVAAMPIPDSQLAQLSRMDTSLGGVIQDKVLLARSHSPYTVKSDLIIEVGGGIYIEPGVELRFVPGTTLHARGGDLVIYGSLQQPVRFRAAAGVFGGVVIRGGHSRLRHLSIENAQTGLRIRQAAPDLHGVVIQAATLVGLHLEEGARPVINCSHIRNSLGMGGLLIEGAGVAPRIRNSVFENNQPFQVQSYAPVQIDLRQNYWGTANPPDGWFLGNDLKWQPVLPEPPQECRRE